MARTRMTLDAVSPEPIQLCDHTQQAEAPRPSNTTDATHKAQRESWCVNCTVADPRIVEGSNLGRYVVWNLTFRLANGGAIRVKRRYNDFVKLHDALAQRYGKDITVCRLPPKSGLLQDRFAGEFLEQRRRSLEYWINTIVLDPVLGFSDNVRQFVLPP